jgi:mono/diheme cytochrome c family protein
MRDKGCGATTKHMRFAATALATMVVLHAAVPTFNRDIAPILYKQCATCHRPGEVAPFPLLTYQDAVRHAPTIAKVTQAGYMPPWKAEPGPHFRNERRLTAEQIALIGDWAAHGAPEGDPAAKPAPPAFPQGWQGGQPDKVFTLPAAFSLPAEGRDQFQCFVIPMDASRDVYIKSFEFRPGNRRIVHHATFFVDPTGAARKRAGASGSYPCFGGPGFSPAVVLGGWAPGGNPDVMDDGTAITVPKGADFVIQLHYHPTGKPETDRSSVGLRFGVRPRISMSQVVLVRNLEIPAGAANYVVKSGITIPWDVKVLAIAPHAHYLGKDMKVTARLPDGATQSLVHVKNWDFNWQIEYFYEVPVKLPKGTQVEFEYSYDNSARNPVNPSNPPVTVRSGDQTTDEMAVLYLNLMLPPGTGESDFQRALAPEYVDQYLEQGANPSFLYSHIVLDAPQRAWLVEAVKAYDLNHDGKLSAGERQALVAALRKRLGLI